MLKIFASINYLDYAAQYCEGYALHMRPETGLHPIKQSEFVRKIARRVNEGENIAIATHSDYIVKELNTLIMLNHDKPHLKQIQADEGYLDDELIDIALVSAYEIAGKRNGTKLVPCDMNPHLGIEYKSFDAEIERMNRIQEAIVRGEP